MQVEWYGQSAFRLAAAEARVFIDPFGEAVAGFAERGIEFAYPPIQGVEADLLLVTHEHADHNGVEAVSGSPEVLRADAGSLRERPRGVVAIASEHDPEAGTARGPNVIFKLELEGLRVAHFGDFGQSELRPEQAVALGEVDLLFLPVGGAPTIGADQALAIVDELRPRWVVPMHYRTSRIGFLETADEFLDGVGEVQRLEGPAFATGDLPDGDEPVAVVPAAP